MELNNISGFTDSYKQGASIQEGGKKSKTQSKLLSQFFFKSVAETIAGLQAEIKTATKALIEATPTVSVSSGCELFVRFITLTEMGEEAVSAGHCANAIL